MSKGRGHLGVGMWLKLVVPRQGLGPLPATQPVPPLPLRVLQAQPASRREGDSVGHSTSHKRAALGATACVTLTCRFLPSHPSLGSGAGWPLALAAAGWSGVRFLGPIVTMTRESGLWSGDPDKEC